MVAGYYLAFFFSLSHNFEGVHMQSDTTRPSNKGSKEQSFLYKQVRSIHQMTNNLFKGCTHTHKENDCSFELKLEGNGPLDSRAKISNLTL